MGELIRRRGMCKVGGGEDPNDGYYGNNLVVRLDGIKNTRQGHQSALTNWENLISSTYDFALTNPTVNADSVYFPASCGAICEDALTMPTNYTIEVYFSLGTEQAYIANDSVLVEMMKSNQYGIMVYYKWNSFYCYPNNGIALTASNLTKDQKYGVSLVKNGSNATVYVNGTQYAQKGASNSSQSIVKTRLSGKLNNVAYSANMLPTIYSVRVYTDALSASTVLSNYNNDVARFS